MKSSLMKSLFFSFIFLMMGCANLFGHHHNVDVKAMPSYEVMHKSQAYNDDALLVHQDFIFSTIHTTLEVDHRTVYTTDNEQVEEEVHTSAKKGASIPALHPAIHFTTQFVAACDTPKKRFQPRNYFVYFPSNTIQILFCTFRI